MFFLLQRWTINSNNKEADTIKISAILSDTLRPVAEENKLNIDKSKLNIERIKYEDGTVLKYSTRSDCVDESFEIIQGNKNSYFSTYDAEYQIEQKNSGFEERQRLVNLINEVENLIKQK